jgi:hypothetical protein
MIEVWPKRIAEAQEILAYSIRGVRYQRVRYGSEPHDWGADRGVPCHDCGVAKGLLHVPLCDVERCPACGRQAISCDCDRRKAS